MSKKTKEPAIEVIEVPVQVAEEQDEKRNADEKEVLTMKDFEEIDDSDMPEPETANYDEHPANSAAQNRGIQPLPKFMELLHNTVGSLPYGTILKNANGEQIKLSDLFKFIEVKSEAKNMTVAEMNVIINFIASCPFDVVRPLMEIIESENGQSELWTLE